MTALLAALAIAVTHNPAVVLECSIPPLLQAQAPLAVGFGGGTRIWLRPRYCQLAYAGTHVGLTVFAHETLHVRLPLRGEAWIGRWDDWYAENVVRWKLGRLRAARVSAPHPFALDSPHSCGYSVPQKVAYQ